MDDWILVKDKLPPNDDWVLVTVKDENGDTPYTYVDFGWYAEVFGCGIWVVDNMLRRDIIAWQPLPKPYHEVKK